MKNILAIDPGIHCGWAANTEGSVKSGVQSFELKRGEGSGMRLLRFENWLRDMIWLVKPEIIAYEAPHIRWARAAQSLQEMVAVIQLYCEKNKIKKYVPVEPSVVKKYATGKGNANKEMMLKEAQRRFGNHIQSQDEADALLILAYAREEYGK